MRKWLCFWLILALALHFSGCAGFNTDSTTVPTTVPDEPTIPTTVEVTESTSAETEPTAPAHSALYHPDYTASQILEYFEEVALHMEYAEGSGDTSLIQKWVAPIRYQINGTPTDEDLEILTALFAQLNEIPGFPGINAAEDSEPVNVTIDFLDPEAFRSSFSTLLQGEDAYGAVQFWYYTATNEIYTASIGYRTDIDQSTRSSVLVEEIINMLGISDTELRSDSIVYQHSNDNTVLSDVDWIIVKLLYNPRMYCGMDYTGCANAIQELYY